MVEPEVRTLVDLVLTTAKNDDTKYLSSWPLDVLLREVERYVVKELKLPAIFADICGRVGTQVDEPAVKILLQIGEINGYRRTVATASEAHNMSVLIENVEVAIDALPSGPRKEWLGISWHDHAEAFAERKRELEPS